MKRHFRLLVCGSREWSDPEPIRAKMQDVAAWAERSGYLPGLIVIEGEARGADTFAKEIAAAHGWECLMFPADWQTEGRAPGPKRNQRMLDEGKPDAVIAFPLSQSRGTADMVERTRAAGLKVWVCSA